MFGLRICKIFSRSGGWMLDKGGKSNLRSAKLKLSWGWAGAELGKMIKEKCSLLQYFFIYIRDSKKVRVVRKKVRVKAKDANDDSQESSEAPREGRHLGLFAGNQTIILHHTCTFIDLYLRLQCSSTNCRSRPDTAQLCCFRNFNLNCCKYRYTPVQSNLWE